MIDFIAGGISLIGSVILLAPIYIVYLIFKGWQNSRKAPKAVGAKPGLRQVTTHPWNLWGLSHK